MTTQPLFSPVRLMPEQNTFDDVSRSALAHMGVKIYLVGALAWDYADTVLSLAAQMRLSGEYKKLARAVRELRRDYDSIRSFDLDADHIENERRLAELFESINKAHFSRLCNGLLTEIRHNPGIDGDMAYFIEAVQMAMTILDTMRLYADQCDVFIRRHYPSAPHSILPEQFRCLATLLPRFAGEYYDRHSEARRITAGILLKEINAIELYE